ncbi:MAG: S-layer homology domain-containing protein [Clostridiales Family XIII bacterium]|nr:S-layer homology domain-containing protein [Clostridiales Family XIII bacterium]
MQGRNAGGGGARSGDSAARGGGEWFADAMAWANAAGLITGRDAKALAPADTATRAEVAAVLHRFAETNRAQ